MATRKRIAKSRGKGRGKTASGAPKLDASSLYFGTRSLGDQATRWLQAQREADSEQGGFDLELEGKACGCILDFEKKYGNPYSFRNSGIRTFDEEKKFPKVRTGGKVVAQLKSMAEEGSVLASCFVALQMFFELTGDMYLDKLGKADTEKREKFLALLDVAASGGFSYAYCMLFFAYNALGEPEAAQSWVQKALDANFDEMVFASADGLRCPTQMQQKAIESVLEHLYALALDHSWDALVMLMDIKKFRAHNEAVSAFTKHMPLIQSLIEQEHTGAMRLFAESLDSCEHQSSRLLPDPRVTRFYERALMQGDLGALFQYIQANFVGSHYVGLAEKDVFLLEGILRHPNLGADYAARIHGLQGRLLRTLDDPKGDKLLLQAAKAGYPEDLCDTILAEFLWGDKFIEYHEDTLLDDKSLDKIPAVLFARGRMLILFPNSEDSVERALKNIHEAAMKGNPDANCWFADSLLRGLHGLKQDTEKGLELLQSLLAQENHPHPHPRVLALEAIRQLGWIKGLRGKGEQNIEWARELFGWAASQKDPLGYVGLVILKSLEAKTQKQQKEMGQELAKAILYARSSGDASALFLLGSELAVNNESPEFNAVCKQCMKTQGSRESLPADWYCGQLAASVLHSASIVGEPQGEFLANLPDPRLGNLEKFRKDKTVCEKFF